MTFKGIKAMALVLAGLLLAGCITGTGLNTVAEADDDPATRIFAEAAEGGIVELDEFVLEEEWGAMGFAGEEEDILLIDDDMPADEAGDADETEPDILLIEEDATAGEAGDADETEPDILLIEEDAPTDEAGDADGAALPAVEADEGGQADEPAQAASLRISLLGVYPEEDDASPLAGFIADGDYAFIVDGPDGLSASVAINVADGAWESARLDGLPFGRYTIRQDPLGLPAGMSSLTGPVELTLTADHTPDAPAEATFVNACTEEALAGYVARAGVTVETERTVGVGQSFTPNYAALFSGVTSSTKYAFASSNKKVATVSSAGTVKAVKAGTALIGILTDSGKKAIFKVIVKKAPTKIALSATKGTLGVGQSKQLTATLSPSGCLKTVAYSSSNAAVAVVSADGCITAVGAGTATIKAKTYNGKSASCKVTVKVAPTAIAMSSPTRNVNIKSTCTLKMSTVPSDAMLSCKYTSSDTSIATVNSAGKVTGKKAGTVTITATSYNGVSCTCNVVVWKAPGKVTLNKTSATLAVGMTLALKGTVPENTNPAIAWVTSNAKIATVSGGLVTAKKVGTAKISVFTSNGKKATCKITVKAKPKTVTVKAAKTTLKVGGTTKATATLTKNSYSPIEWSVEGDAVTVDKSGNITAVNIGTATVMATATAANIAGTVTITVSETGSSAKKIIDISKWQGTIDFDKLKPNVSLVIARASCGTTIDSKFVSYAKAMNARGIPFGVYCYSHASSAAIAQAEATALVSFAKAYSPKFYVIDAEASEITKAAIVAFAAQLRALGVKKVGAYVGHHRYSQYGFSSIKDKFDFVWIPRYGSNDGTVAGAIKPDYPCDLWQYTSKGTVPGISGRVDVSVLTGQGKSLSWFIS